MYLPFLRGKLFEFKAIKEFIDESYNCDFGCHVMPIIEPVKKDRNPMMACIESMGKARMPFAVVLNSRMGDYQRTTFGIDEFLAEERLKAVTDWAPAFEVNGNANSDAIEKVIGGGGENEAQNVTQVFVQFQTFLSDVGDTKVDKDPRKTDHAEFQEFH